MQRDLGPQEILDAVAEPHAGLRYSAYHSQLVAVLTVR